MKTKWTEEQESAIVTRGCNLLVAAAAGSGKTAVLVERIIRMIIDTDNPVDIDRLLVVTFTNAAASEMRERVGDAISKKLDENPSSKELQRQLTLLNRSNITTMHSFCLDVVKNNFHCIDLDPNFRIADQTEIILMRQEILDEVFEEKYEENTVDFKKLVDSLGGKRDDRNIKELIEDIYNFIMSGPSPKIWLKEKVEELNISDDFDLEQSVWVKILLKGIDNKLKTFINDMENIKQICDDENLLKAKENIKETISDLYIAVEAYGKSIDSFIRALNNIKFSRLTIKGIDEEVKKEITDTRNNIKDSISKIQKSINFTIEESKYAIQHMYPILKTLSEVTISFMDKFEIKKREKGILDFNDLEHLCLRILNDGYDTGELIPSEVAIQFRNKFDEVLIDEYQDSNNVQETIINLVSRKLTDKPNVFMVGDVKQSIYRFRQAKPELFLKKYNEYSKDKGNNRKILLYKNFRSRNEIIDSVNYVFKKIMSKEVGELEYTDEEALNLGATYPENKEENVTVGGATELHLIDMKTNEENTEKEISDTEEGLDKIQIEARLIAKRIKSLMNGKEKFKVFDKKINDYRDIKFKDIVILLRATRNWADIFTEELSNEDIPAYADASAGYFETIEIKTMIALLQIVDNPLQDIPMISILRSPIFSFTPEELIDLRLFNKEKYFYQILNYIANDDMSECKYESGYLLEDDTKKKAKLVVDSINLWRDKALHMPIDEFVWYLYKDTHYYGYVGAMPNGVQRQANLRVLFQRAKQYENTSFKGLFNFINFINKLKKSSGDMGSAKILGENENVVRIMSIHKSKGLEFPVVFLSGCGKKFNDLDLKGQILYHEELGFGPDYINYDENYKFSTIAKEAIKKKIKNENLSEEMRVLYVAFTRAREKLIITGVTKDLNKDCDKWIKSIKNNKISSDEVLNSSRYLDWIGMSIIMHKDGKALRDLIDVNNSNNYENLSTWNVFKYDKSYFSVDKKNNNVEKILNEDEIIPLDENMERIAYKNEINRRLNWDYEFKESSKIQSNISVSELKRTMFEEEEEEEQFNNLIKKDESSEIIIKKPTFLQEKKGLSSSERGTAVHTVMQHINIIKCNTIKEIQNQLTFMVAKEFLTEEEVNCVNPFKIQKFFKTCVGELMLEEYKKNPKNINREQPFYIEIPSTVVNKELPSQYENEKIRIQGVIDCFIEQEDGIILIDYKTDYVDIDDDDWKKKMIKKYKLQIDYYTEALKRITGKNVKERYLYLFYLEKELKI